jgi:hypothetical protein
MGKNKTLSWRHLPAAVTKESFLKGEYELQEPLSVQDIPAGRRAAVLEGIAALLSV